MSILIDGRHRTPSGLIVWSSLHNVEQCPFQRIVWHIYVSNLPLIGRPRNPAIDVSAKFFFSVSRNLASVGLCNLSMRARLLMVSCLPCVWEVSHSARSTVRWLPNVTEPFVPNGSSKLSSTIFFWRGSPSLNTKLIWEVWEITEEYILWNSHYRRRVWPSRYTDVSNMPLIGQSRNPAIDVSAKLQFSVLRNWRQNSPEIFPACPAAYDMFLHSKCLWNLTLGTFD